MAGDTDRDVTAGQDVRIGDLRKNTVQNIQTASLTLTKAAFQVIGQPIRSVFLVRVSSSVLLQRSARQ